MFSIINKNKCKEKNMKNKIKNVNNIKKDKEKNVNILELSYVLGNKNEIIKRNFIAGIARGIGTGIGITIISAIIIIILKRIILLNIPIIGDYISDIIQIVENR